MGLMQAHSMFGVSLFQEQLEKMLRHILEHLKFQRDAMFALLIIKHILSQMHNRGCMYECVCTRVHV